MYCVKCGIEMSQGQTVCPACNTRVYHPDIPRDENQATYPRVPFKSEEPGRLGFMFVITVICAMAAFLPLIYEASISGKIAWSGYVTGGVILLYQLAFMPIWFRNPLVAVFLPVDFLTVAGYLCYIDFATGGDWFMTFAFPVTGALGMIVTAAAVLTYYLRHGKLYIFGGMFIALGAFVTMVELLINLTFGIETFIFWSFIPLAAFFLFGITLIVIGIVKPFKRSFEKVFNL